MSNTTINIAGSDTLANLQISEPYPVDSHHQLYLNTDDNSLYRVNSVGVLVAEKELFNGQLNIQASTGGTDYKAVRIEDGTIEYVVGANNNFGAQVLAFNSNTGVYGVLSVKPTEITLETVASGGVKLNSNGFIYGSDPNITTASDDRVITDVRGVKNLISDLGDNLGNHIATQAINFSNFKGVNVLQGSSANDAGKLSDTIGSHVSSSTSPIIASTVLPLQYFTMAPTGSGGVNQLLIPPASSTLKGFKIYVRSVGVPGFNTNEIVSTSTHIKMHDESSVSNLIVPFEMTYELTCMSIDAAGTYRWIVKQYDKRRLYTAWKNFTGSSYNSTTFTLDPDLVINIAKGVYEIEAFVVVSGSDGPSPPNDITIDARLVASMSPGSGYTIGWSCLNNVDTNIKNWTNSAEFVSLTTSTTSGTKVFSIKGALHFFGAGRVQLEHKLAAAAPSGGYSIQATSWLKATRLD